MRSTRTLGVVAALLHMGVSVSALSAFATERPKNEPDWTAGAPVPPMGRTNPYGWEEQVLAAKIRRGKLYALNYPVSVTGLRMPARSTLKVLDLKPGDFLFGLLRAGLFLSENIRSFDGFWNWLGVHDYPLTEDGAESEIPFPDGVRPQLPMGVSLLSNVGLQDPGLEKLAESTRATSQSSDGAVWIPESDSTAIRGRSAIIAVSCAACHSATLFGKSVLGLTNRFSRANEFFILGQEAAHKIAPVMFQLGTGATREERDQYAYSREHLQSVGLKKPVALGLDTSLAQVALSLARREAGADARRSKAVAANPRANLLDTHVADSKPAVWWNVKYKNRWLSDGSVMSGNPILTNLLWNEIGRGADLPELEKWLARNESVVEDLTTAVFATRAPRWQAYLPASFVDIARARRGEAIFARACVSCHGEYRKDWARGTDTVTVRYTTSIRDVGTDPGRREGMRALAEGLNPLAISRRMGVVVEEQSGYVPPPLEGIWARYPYLHNNSVPSLCALMTPPESRPREYYMGDAVVAGRDYDVDCVGYPAVERAPAAWKADPAYRYTVGGAGSGRSNAGHYDGIFRSRDGRERFTPDQKRDLREYLKTL